MVLAFIGGHGSYWGIGPHEDLFVFSIKINDLYIYILTMFFVFMLNITITYIEFYSEKFKKEFFKQEDVVIYKKIDLIYNLIINIVFKRIFMVVLFIICTQQFDFFFASIFIQLLFIILYGLFQLKNKKYNSNGYENILSIFNEPMEGYQ